MTKPKTFFTNSAETQTVQLLGISGSLREASFNRRLLQAAARDLSGNVSLELWNGLGAVPPFNEDEESWPAPLAVAALRDAIRAADGILIATPEYNRSVPGQLKNALDWASRPPKQHALLKKPVAVISASPSPRGAADSQAETQRVLGSLGAQVIGDGLTVAYAHQAFGEDGQLIDPALRRHLAEIIEKLVAASRKQKPANLVRT